jgi:hypothetical protein
MLDHISPRNDSACSEADRRIAPAPAGGHRPSSIRCGGFVRIGELIKRLPWLARLLRQRTSKHPR